MNKVIGLLGNAASKNREFNHKSEHFNLMTLQKNLFSCNCISCFLPWGSPKVPINFLFILEVCKISPDSLLRIVFATLSIHILKSTFPVQESWENLWKIYGSK